ncbi:MAG TPA: hypothetical protein DCS35_10270 [Vibrio sp.]|nr:hypothetical protein [Vibrio sp.]
MHIVKQVRSKLGDSQEEFAKRLAVSVDTVKSWELGRRKPSEARIGLFSLLAGDDDLDLKKAIQDMHPHHAMANEIYEYITEELDEKESGYELRFVIYGESGSGKSRAIHLVNEKLTDSGKLDLIGELAECTDLVHQRNLCKAWDIITDQDLAYQNSQHIVFSTMSADIANSLEQNNIKVFRF